MPPRPRAAILADDRFQPARDPGPIQARPARHLRFDSESWNDIALGRAATSRLLEVVGFASRLGADGPSYEALGRARLGGREIDAFALTERSGASLYYCSCVHSQEECTEGAMAVAKRQGATESKSAVSAEQKALEQRAQSN